MIYREANIEDIAALSSVRLSVNENKLSNPGLVTAADYVEFLTIRGKGWLCEMDEKVIGFAIVDLVENNVWALFLLPEFVGKGIGHHLHQLMMDWYFQQTDKTIWLGTAPGTKAEIFYKKAGWTSMGVQKNGEVRFEMKHSDWVKKRN